MPNKNGHGNPHDEVDPGKWNDPIVPPFPGEPVDGTPVEPVDGTPVEPPVYPEAGSAYPTQFGQSEPLVPQPYDPPVEA